MKRLMLAAMLLVSTATVFATETKGKTEGKTTETTQVNRKQTDECTVSISGKVGPAFAQVEVKCSYTSSSCQEALTQVKKCIQDAKSAVMQ